MDQNPQRIERADPAVARRAVHTPPPRHQDESDRQDLLAMHAKVLELKSLLCAFTHNREVAYAMMKLEECAMWAEKGMTG